MINAASDFIFVEKIYNDKQGVIHIPESARKNNSGYFGKVISIGNDFPFKNDIKVNDIVVFNQHEGFSIKDNVVALKPERILAVCK